MLVILFHRFSQIATGRIFGGAHQKGTIDSSETGPAHLRLSKGREVFLIDF